MVRRTTRFGKPKPKRAKPKARPRRPAVTIRPVQPLGRTLPSAFGLSARNLLGVPEERIAVRGQQVIQRIRPPRPRPAKARLKKIVGARGKVKGFRFGRPAERVERRVPSLDPFQRSGITFIGSQAPPRRPIPPPRTARIKKIKTRGEERFQRPARPERPPRPTIIPAQRPIKAFEFVPFQQEVRGFRIASERGRKRVRATAGQAVAGRKIFGDLLSGIEGFIEETPIGITQREVKRRAEKVGSAFDVLNLFG